MTRAPESQAGFVSGNTCFSKIPCNSWLMRYSCNLSFLELVVRYDRYIRYVSYVHLKAVRPWIRLVPKVGKLLLCDSTDKTKQNKQTRALWVHVMTKVIHVKFTGPCPWIVVSRGRRNGCSVTRTPETPRGAGLGTGASRGPGSVSSVTRVPDREAYIP